MDTSLEELLALAVFARVVEARSFTGAAARLGLSKSAVSTRVSALEERLGVRLLHRTTRRIVVTPEGALLYERCAHLLSTAAEASELMGNVGEVQGVVRVAAPVGLAHHYLAAMLREFSERHPRVQLELAVSDRPVDVLAEGFDIALRVARRPAEASLIIRRIGSERMVVCGTDAYFSRHPAPQAPHDLIQHNCLRLLGREWVFKVGEETAAIPVSGTLVVDNIAVLRDAVLSGAGLAMLPSSLVDSELREGRLRSVLDAYSLGDLDIYLAYAHRKHLPRKVRAVVDFLTEHFRAPARR